MNFLQGFAATALRHCVKPEVAHRISLKAINAGLGPWRTAEITPHRLFGKAVQSRFGIAAGADKNLATIHGWRAMGAGLVEYGSVARRPRPGNPQPRVWRFPQYRSTVNWMGLNSIGADAFLARLQSAEARDELPAYNMAEGISLVAPEGDLTLKERDLSEMAMMFAPYADYFAINISCPNSEDAAARDVLGEIGRQVAAAVESAQGVPVIVKLAPTHDMAMLRKVAEVCINNGAKGFAVCNTMTYDLSLDAFGDSDEIPDSDEWPRNAEGQRVGGYSGPALKYFAYKMLEALKPLKEKHGLTLIGVGGVQSPETVGWMLKSGADAVQVYNGLVYNPLLIDDLNRADAAGRFDPVVIEGRGR